MRCRKCGAKAAINMHQHRLSLCAEHFSTWMQEQTRRFIEKYAMFTRTQRILVAVSGGKDSLTLWDILHRLGYQADGLYINLGILPEYSAESEQKTRIFADARGLSLHVVRVEDELGAGLPVISRRSQRGIAKPCSVCGTIKRHLMNRLARDGGYEVVVTGHNLDDEAAVLFGNTLNWSVNLLRRQMPVLEERAGLQRKAKPLCRFYERETTAYALLNRIDYVVDECPFSEGSLLLYYKDTLNRMEAGHPGLKLAFYLKFLHARQTGLFGSQQDEGNEDLRTCPDCGMPTQADGICTYCRLKGKSIELTQPPGDGQTLVG